MAVFWYKDTSEKVTMQRIQQFSDVFCYPERIQLNAMHVQLLEKLRPIAFAETSWFPTTSHKNFKKSGAKKKVQKLREWSIKKIWILTWGIFNNTEHGVKTIYGELRKSEQFWQRGFHVNS